MDDSFDFGDFVAPPELGPEPKTPVFTQAQGRGEPGSTCYTCGVPFRTWVDSVTLRDFLTLCRWCLHFLERR